MLRIGVEDPDEGVQAVAGTQNLDTSGGRAYP